MKRPELKTPELKTPQWMTEMVSDLRERRLLPVAIGLVIAILAVPVLLSSGGGSEPANEAAASAAAAADGSQAAQLAVVSQPENLRDYKRRLKDMHAKDPFKQQYTAPAADASAAKVGALTQTVAEPPTPSAGDGAAASDGATATPATGSGASKSPSGQARVITYTIDAWVGETGHLKHRNQVRRFEALPGSARSVVVFVGAPVSAKTAMFMVSDNVTAVRGGGRCVLEEDGCSLVALKPGRTARFQYGDGKVYAVKLLKIERSAAGHSGD